MNKGRQGIILRYILLTGMFCIISIPSASLAFAQEEKQPTSESIEFGEIPFVVFWQELFATWGQAIAENLVNVLAFFVVIGVGYFVGRGVSGALHRVLRRIFKDYLHDQLTEEDLKDKSSWSQITTLIPFTAKWFVWIYAFVIAIDLLGFAEASEWLGVLWTFIPNIVALKWMSEYKPDLFGTDGTMQIIKSLVNAIIFAFVFGIGITQLGIGEDIIPIVFWTVLSGIMGIFIVSAYGLRHAVTKWSYGESLKHLGIKNGSEVDIDGVTYTIQQVGITHTKVTSNGKTSLIPNEDLGEKKVMIKKEAPEDKKSKPSKPESKTDEQTGKKSETE